VLFNHHTKGIEAIRLRRIRCLGEGETGAVLPPDLAAGGHKNKYRRLFWDKPAPTITAHIGKDLSDFIHPTFERWITVREAARIQSFPDSYIFLGSESQQLKQIGNAVPPLLGAALFWNIGRELGLKINEKYNQP
jgi:DNA (cytosine-5)-methyltransferase 1